MIPRKRRIPSFRKQIRDAKRIGRRENKPPRWWLKHTGTTGPRRRGIAGTRRRYRRTTRRGRRVGAATSVLRTLFPINKYLYTTGQREVVDVTNSDGTGNPCKWFVPQRAAGNVSLAYPSWIDMLDVAKTVNDASITGYVENGRSGVLKFHTADFHQDTKIVNCSNGQIVLDMYVCTSRKPIPNITFPAEGTGTFVAYDILNFLGHGFWLAGTRNQNTSGLGLGDDTPYSDVISGPANRFNQAMNDDSFSPFDSPTFCHYFKIGKRTSTVLNAGDIRRFRLNVKRKLTHNPLQYKNPLSGTQTWQYDNSFTLSTASNHFPEGAKFMLFKVRGQPATVNGSLGVGLTQPAVDVVTNVWFTYQNATNHGPLTYRASNYGINANVNAAQIVLEGSSVIAPHAVAGATPP